MANILFVTTSLFPEGQAYSTRVLNFCRMLSSVGFDVHVIAERSLNMRYERNITYLFGNFTFELVGTDSKLYRYIKKPNILKHSMEEYLTRHTAKYAILNINSINSYRKAYKLCLNNNVKVIRETCEWYDTSSYKLGVLDPRFIAMNIYTRNGWFKSDGVIAISRLLENHNKKLGTKTIRIPTILDVQKISVYKHCQGSDRKIIIIFAGSRVGKDHKEQLRNFCLALIRLGSNSPFELRIYGSDYPDVVNNLGTKDGSSILKDLNGKIKIRGVVGSNEIYEGYKLADYSLVLRPDRLSSNAGFPTKLGESLATGTPVIANDTGDIGVYIKDGENGYLVEDSSVDAICATLQKVQKNHKKKIINMRENARISAQMFFDFRVYESKILGFMLSL